jgi:glutamine synthetase type III
MRRAANSSHDGVQHGRQAYMLLQVALNAHKAEASTAYAPAAALHDAEARFATQVAGLDAHLQEHLADAAATLSGAAIAAGQSRVDALQERLTTQISDLEAKVCMSTAAFSHSRWRFDTFQEIMFAAGGASAMAVLWLGGGGGG